MARDRRVLPGTTRRIVVEIPFLTERMASQVLLPNPSVRGPLIAVVALGLLNVFLLGDTLLSDGEAVQHLLGQLRTLGRGG